MRLLNRKGAEPDMTMTDGSFDFRGTRCPRCGKVSWMPSVTNMFVGRSESDYVCTNYVGMGGRECGCRIRTVSQDPGIVWVSPNGRWYIYDPAQDTSGTRYRASAVNGVYASDGTVSYWSTIYNDGRIAHDDVYAVPKYVLKQVERVLSQKGYTQWGSGYNLRPGGLR